ncbi:BQ2448_1939 [Microbotryum intermedium]|uniref:BQ2448_1939 protein n=1 Tax=Microbotryum intermedium TaxID=269621 RepID=A0A238F832_9BASI|nr:BQ2448_1939 [Microbotryum intermedium]
MSSSSSYVKTPSDLLEALKQFSTCEISDALVKLKIPSGGHVPDMKYFGTRTPSSDEERLVGEVFTVKMVEASDLGAPKLQGDVKSASLGGLLAAGLHVKGVQGVVIDGRCRDLQEIKSLGMPVFATSHSTLGQSPFTRPSSIQQTLEITHPHWPPIHISPHDVLIADLDGVVVVPYQKVQQVVEFAKKGKEVNERCMKDILQGEGVGESFARHRGVTGKH